MAKRVMCKFFAHGGCLKGEHCEFAHDWKAPSSNICTLFQKGICTFGNRCRYEHAKLSMISAAASTGHVPSPVGEDSSSSTGGDDGGGDDADMQQQHIQLNDDMNNSISNIINNDDDDVVCWKGWLEVEREEQLKKSSERRRKHIEALRSSEEIECSVCLEVVISKGRAAAERKFGILSECDHSFCISCIRNWRSPTSSGMNVRGCPICRRLSYYVIPSVVWYWSREEKQDIIESYKTRLRCIDCKHFDFGKGCCPFGTSCFYRHVFDEEEAGGGVDQEVGNRHVGGDDDGDTAAIAC